MLKSSIAMALVGAVDMIENQDRLFCNLEGAMNDGSGTPANLIFHQQQDYQKGTADGGLFEAGPKYCLESCVANMRSYWGKIDSGSLCCTAMVREEHMICAMAYAATLEYDNDQGFLENYDGYTMYNAIFSKPNWPFMSYFLTW